MIQRKNLRGEADAMRFGRWIMGGTIEVAEEGGSSGGCGGRS